MRKKSSMTNARIVVRSLEGFTEKLIKRLSLNVTANLVETTPVDTGWARANWVPSIGSPRSRTAGTRAAAENGSIDNAPQLNGIISLANYRVGPSIFISNNVPYINSLNSGTSTQAPSAFVQNAILRAVRKTVK